MIKKMQYYLSVALFDLAAWTYPLVCPGVAQTHYVGRRWLRWELREENRCEN